MSVDDLVAEYLSADNAVDRERLGAALRANGVELDEIEFLAEVLGSAPSWEQPSPDLEERIMIGVLAQASRPQSAPPAPPAIPAIPAMPVSTGQAGVVDLAARRAAKQRKAPWVLGIAAALVLGTFIGRVGLSRSADFDGRASLLATGLAPGATATVRFRAEDAGVRLEIDAANLPQPGPGQFYEGWVTDGTVLVSVGSFSASGRATLWSGVSTEMFHTMSVTLEDSDGNAKSSGRVVLKGPLAPR
jgi:hypothetical protein